MKFVLATNNQKKLKEMAAILESLGVEVVSPTDLGIYIEVEETGITFAENAMLKAKAICEAANLPAIADDSGLCVDALNGGPGVYSARYGGEGLDDVALLDLQYSEDSRAQVDLNCIMNERGEIIELQGTGEGRAFTLTEQQDLVRLCAKGNRELLAIQKEVLEGRK